MVHQNRIVLQIGELDKHVDECVMVNRTSIGLVKHPKGLVEVKVRLLGQLTLHLLCLLFHENLVLEELGHFDFDDAPLSGEWFFLAWVMLLVLLIFFVLQRILLLWHTSLKDIRLCVSEERHRISVSIH